MKEFFGWVHFKSDGNLKTKIWDGKNKAGNFYDNRHKNWLIHMLGSYVGNLLHKSNKQNYCHNKTIKKHEDFL